MLAQCTQRQPQGCFFDIDYRPNLWALGEHGDGEDRSVNQFRDRASAKHSAAL